MSWTSGMSKEQKLNFAKEMFAAMGCELVVQGEENDNKSNCEEGE